MLNGSREGHIASIHVSQKSSGRSTATTRVFRRQLNVSFADILADTLKFGSHCRARRKEDGSRSLGRSSDTVHYGASNGREIEVEESRKSHGVPVEQGAGRSVYRERLLTSVKPEPAIVRYEWLSRWTFPYPNTCIRFATAYQIFSMLEISIEYIARVSDLPARLRLRERALSQKKREAFDVRKRVILS